MCYVTTIKLTLNELIMASALNEVLKPARFDTEPNSPKAAKQLKHLLNVFTNYLERCERLAEAQEDTAFNRLQVLFAFVSAEVYEFIEDFETYDAAITKLKGIYIKSPNIIFVRHQLVTRKQQLGETLHEFYQSLQVTSKDCDFKNFSAEDYRKELVRDAFINGLNSHTIRQRLLENSELTADQAFDIANSLSAAQQHSEAYLFKSDVSSLASSHSPKLPTNGNSDETISKNDSIGAMSNRTCYFCGLAYHLRNRCPAKEAKCFTCGKVWHFSKVCRSRASGRHTNQVLRKTASSYSDPSPALCTISAASPASLLPASLPVTLNGTKVTALVDSGSSESYVNSNICDKLNLHIYPTSTHQVQMASTAVKIKSKAFVW